jgi:hypothetical protein
MVVLNSQPSAFSLQRSALLSRLALSERLKLTARDASDPTSSEAFEK